MSILYTTWILKYLELSHSYTRFRQHGGHETPDDSHSHIQCMLGNKTCNQVTFLELNTITNEKHVYMNE